MARSFFTYSVVRADPSNLTTGGDSILTSLKSVDWEVKKLDTSNNETSTAIYSGSTGNSVISGSAGTTDWNGLIEFWAEPGLYVVKITDSKSRIANKDIYWDSVSGQTGGIPGDIITSDSLTTDQIKDSEVKTADIASSAVTSAKIGTGEVKTANIDAGAVTSAKIGAGEVKNTNIDTGVVTTAKIADSAINPAKLATDAVTNTKIQNGAVTSAKILAGDIYTDNLASGAVTGPKIASNAVTSAKIAANEVKETNIDNGLFVPVGCIMQYAGTSAPTNWLMCDGAAVSRSTYGALFSSIGTGYGVGNGTTTFNVPDLRGRVPVGQDNMGTAQGAASRLTSNSSRGNSGGAETHTLGTSEIPSHTHTGTTATESGHTHTGTVDSAGGHSHTGTTGNESANHTHSGTTGNESVNHVHGGTTYQAGEHYHGIGDIWHSTPGAYPGGPGADYTGVSILPIADWNTVTTTAPHHTHDFLTGGVSQYHTHNFTSGGVSANHTHSFTTATDGAHQHTFTSAAGSAHSHTFTTNGTGSGSSHNNLQPYVVVNYIIRAA